ncbi:MAG TPA: phosphatidylglycerol lysyltransferase domain-containing protein [Candidatus Saccharimonadales bacterium]|nr:phosphatidylglycerol lysyltransferase domain-containing protein [Candidatus Saccharimonadales bacterium]
MDHKSRNRSNTVLTIVIFSVAINGILLITATLLDEIILRHHIHPATKTIFGLPLIEGLTLLYLSFFLLRRKRKALYFGIPAYLLILLINIIELFAIDNGHRQIIEFLLRGVVFPMIIIGGLLYYHEDFTVRSDTQSFKRSLKFTGIVLGIALLYGVAGFMLMDKHDFRQEINFPQAILYTIDRFGLISKHALVAHTLRARLFTRSLSIISVGALGYSLVSLFQPIRARFRSQTDNREHVLKLLELYGGNSEDFFKLWPQTKAYFFSEDIKSVLAFHVYLGVALCVGDPIGDQHSFGPLVEQYKQFCYVNDWLPAFIHTNPDSTKLYRENEFTLQKIGEEAILNIDHYKQNVQKNKYFRHIINRFTKLGYETELLKPPHSPDLINRLAIISKEWLSQPGRAERGFMMGYFTPEYMQICPILVARDADGEIQAFINQIVSFDKHEANFDLLRHTNSSPGNINDYLLNGFIHYASESGFRRLNLGLCPLTGLNKDEADQTIIDSTLRFAYANGDRFYSFSGLYRFKSKYEPEWSSRYIAYRNGIRGFTKTANALIRAMSKIPRR